MKYWPITASELLFGTETLILSQKSSLYKFGEEETYSIPIKKNNNNKKNNSN